MIPYVAPTPGWGMCPECECGGRERPCWNCGHDGKFLAGIASIIQVEMRPWITTPEVVE
jgi:hypothetical protein